MDEAELKKHVERRLKAMEDERKSWESHWKDLAAHFLPHRARFLDNGDRTNEGDKRNINLFDSCGRTAARTLASGMQSGLTSPARPWFKLAMQNKELEQKDEAKYWLHDTYTRMVAIFGKSNFYEQMHTLYGELAVFGTGCMLVEEDGEDVIRFKTLTAGEYVVDTDASGRVNTLGRRIMMTPLQIEESWPEACPQEIKDKVERDNNDWMEVIHLIEPNKAFKEGGKAGKERAFTSIYMLKAGQKTILEHSGYYEFPALCPRWETTGSDIYGRSPGMDALPDCRMLQRMAKDGLEALELEVKPPLNVTTATNESVDITPGAINYIPPHMAGQAAVTPLYQVKANLPALEQSKANQRDQIRGIFFNNLFMMLADTNKQMTATEVAERNSEKMLMLGPVLDRLRSELFQPLIVRVSGVMHRQGLLALAPDFMQGESIEIEFVSILAQAQKQAGISAIQQIVGFVGEMAQLSPSALDKLDTDEAIDEIAGMLGIPPRLIRSDDVVEALREQREQQMQQQQVMEAMQQGAGIAKDGASAMASVGMTVEGMQGGMDEQL